MNIDPMAARVPDPTRHLGRFSALAISVVGYAFDGFDTLIIGFMLPAIVNDMKLDRFQGGLLVTATLIGAMLGGMVLGAISDRGGRIKILTWTVLIFAAATGLSSIVQSYWQLLLLRVVAGVGLGGEFGIGMALVAETWPRDMRTRASSYVVLGWQAGVLAAALTVPALLAVVGWRGVFLVGVVPAFVAFALRAHLLAAFDSERRNAAITRAPTSSHTLSELLRDRPKRRLSLTIAFLCSIQNFGYYGIMIWLPSFFAETYHFPALQSAVWTAATVLGMAVGLTAFGQIADRVGRRDTFLLFQCGAAASVLCFSTLREPVSLLMGGAVMGVFVNGMVGGYAALISDVFPAAARATAQNTLFNIGRLIGSTGPLFIALVSNSAGFAGAIGMLSLIYVAAFLATAVAVPKHSPSFD